MNVEQTLNQLYATTLGQWVPATLLLALGFLAVSCILFKDASHALWVWRYEIKRTWEQLFRAFIYTLLCVVFFLLSLLIATETYGVTSIL